ncbi:MAG TPA: deoxyribose-phosphate aldolase [Lachnospiraceae bacterium]|nr:deoxyribose-phosphate aldolase [Lachnospiraceae bacterium]
MVTFIKKLPQMIDISCVKQSDTMENINHMIELAKRYHTICCFTLPGYTHYLIDKLLETDILVGGTVGFPSGCDTTESKVFQARELMNMGCDEYDMVMNISRLKSKDISYVYHDIKAVVDTVKTRPVKVILEVTLLTEAEIVLACKVAMEAGVAYVKTGTGWCSEPTTVEHIRLIKDVVKDQVKIKAAGGIRTLDTVIDMYKTGCNRFGIGTDSAIRILEEAEVRCSLYEIEGSRFVTND